jgi:endonuclease YncB( thermonuclease family)
VTARIHFGSTVFSAVVFFTAALLILQSCRAARAADPIGIPRILDGDTIEIEGVKIRLEGIDAPETNQFCLDDKGQPWACGKTVLDQLTKKVGARSLTCRVSGQDVYKRSLASCYIDAEDIQRWMVRSGFALSFKRYSHKYDADESAAREAKAGLWSGAFIAPWDWRHRNKSTEILGALSVPIGAQAVLLQPDSSGPPPVYSPTRTAPAAAPIRTSTSTGRCQNADDLDARGHRCGGRASNERKAKRAASASAH